jgi:hypothetical protein
MEGGPAWKEDRYRGKTSTEGRLVRREDEEGGQAGMEGRPAWRTGQHGGKTSTEGTLGRREH